MGYVRDMLAGAFSPGVTEYRGEDRCGEARQTDAAAAAAAGANADLTCRERCSALS